MSDLGPALGVILLAPYGVDKLADILLCLREQTVARSLQLVVVADAASAPFVQTFEAFHSNRFLTLEHFDGAGSAKALAIRNCDADIIVFAEDHCFPEADWAEALIAAHREGHAAVSPWMGSANPRNCWSTASFFDFIPSNSGMRGLRQSLPTHNSSYKRRLLLEFGDDLGDLLEMETAYLVPDLLARGWTILHEPAAKVWHVNLETFKAFALQQFCGGRHYGAIRSEHWSLARRLVYAAGSSLIPFLRCYRQGHELWGKIPPRSWAPLMVSFVLSALGEGWGYWAGQGNTREIRLDLEFWRERFLKGPRPALEIVPTLGAAKK